MPPTEPSPFPEPRSSRLAWGIKIAVALLFAAFALRESWLPLLGRLLIDAEPPVKSDLIVVLAGDWTGGRIVHAAGLARQGFATHVLVSGPRHHYGLFEHELAISFAVKQGFPPDMFIPFPLVGAHNTEDEARRILPEARRRGVRSLLVVTSDYHTRRARRIYRSLVGRSDTGGLELHVSAAPDTVFRAGSWWRHREARKIFLLEFTKLVTSYFGI